MNRSLPDIPKEWIQQARLADESAIEKIYSKTYPKAYTIAYYSLGATNKFQDEAQTITQDSMRKAFEKLDQLKDDDKFAPWMYTILNNSIRDYFRAHKNKDYQTNTFSELDSEDFRDNYEESIADDSVAFNPEANINTELIAEGLKGCLDKLPDNQRFALMMQMYQQLTTKEIAEQMEVEENTVKSWIRRAKLSIKDMIEELRSQNKSFYTVAPLPFLAWMLDQELKTIPSFNAKTFADGVVMKVKADTITSNPIREDNASLVKKNNVNSKGHVTSQGVKQATVSATGKVAAGIGVKVAAGVAIVSVAAFGGYRIVNSLANNQLEQTKIEKNDETTKKSEPSEEIKEETKYEYETGTYNMLQEEYVIYDLDSEGEVIDTGLILKRNKEVLSSDKNIVGTVSKVDISWIKTRKNKETGETQYWGYLKNQSHWLLIREGSEEFLKFDKKERTQNESVGCDKITFAERVCETNTPELYPDLDEEKIVDGNLYNVITKNCQGEFIYF